MTTAATRTPSFNSGPTWLGAAAGLAGLAGIFIVLGHDGRRVAQLALLSLPVLAWMAWPLRQHWTRIFRRVAVWAWVMLFALDGAARAFLLDAYQAAPDGALVLGALANTNSRESSEYLQSHWRALLLWGAAIAVAGAVAWRLAGRGLPARSANASPSRWLCTALVLLFLLSCIAYASKPWRRLHPAAFWANWTQSIRQLGTDMADQRRARDQAFERARAAAPVIADEGPSTVVLVVTDSINRDNMGLYGYGRDTTPRLRMHQRQAGNNMLVLRNAWSADASTLPALRNLFSFGEPDSTQAQHLLALARAAGYKTWWMSNHDDVAIEQQHARLADVVEFVNRTPGRASASLDGELLDCVQEALEDPAQRKLIVVHLLGAHPHYRLRFPEGENPFDDEPDAVDAQLEKQGRSGWVRRFRQDYDAALLYHDFVVSETLQLTRMSGGPNNGHRAWMYISDHGQEVGHVSDRAGHSPNTESGYRIPAVVWRSKPLEATAAQSGQLPFRADWAAWTVADLLRLRWSGQMDTRNVLSPAYRWEAPALPVQVKSFVD